jgi:hypothetical protein
MKRRLFVGLLLTTCALSGQTPAQRRALVHGGEVWIPGPPLDHVPRWNGSLLVGCDQCRSNGPLLWTVDRQGRRDEIAFELAGAGFIAVDDIASGSDGALAVAGYALSNDSRIASFIAWISPDRKRQIVTRTWPFCPYMVALVPDGTIWAVGPVKVGDTTDNLTPNVLRHYDPSGRMIAAADVKARGYNGLAEVASGSYLRASPDRVGWLTHGCEYIEFSFSAVEIGRYNCPNGIWDSHSVGGIALSSANDVLVGGKDNGPLLTPFELDRARHTWNPVAVPADTANGWDHILGFDGLTLVTYPLAFPAGKLRWFNWAEGPAAASGH